MLFNRMKKMSNVLIKKIDKIDIEHNRCLKVRAVISSCSVCTDVCPAPGSIQINQDSLELQDCLDCGLCTTVCPTNALKWNSPPLSQIEQRIKRLAKNEQTVYITCSAMEHKTGHSSIVEVPCLGMLPAEFWLNIGLSVNNLSILVSSDNCKQCSITTGEQVFQQQLDKAYENHSNPFPICSEVSLQNQTDSSIDHGKRNFLSSLMEEVKETNTITVKEVLEVNKTLSPFEKFDQYYQQKNEIEEISDEVNEIKQSLADQVLKDNVIHTDKRSLLLSAFKQSPQLQEEMTILMPTIKESCTRCGACSFLCPTDALYADGKDIILATNKCVSCQLCVEICYEKHISMEPKAATIMNNKYMYILKS
ncbi:ATP-binding protein [Bacillus massiliigorillae]|uniref:ATP-binding protein n=1 Tax=Bacillus massiliigorillae TaxID=1243664 RepID=UPI0003A583F7|nr:4Fe-4S binding protein [Bacillus massiliigorillae]